MKQILKEYWIYILVALLCGALWVTHKEMSHYKTQSETLETTITDLNQELRLSKIRLNDSIEVYQAEVKNLNFTKDNLEAKYNQLIKASQLKPKDVNSVTEIVTVIHQIDTVVAVKDAFGGIKASLQDPFVSIDVEVKPDLNTIIDYEVQDSLTVINVQKKHSWLFGLIKWKEHKTTRVINHNPKANITNLQTIDVFE